MFLPCPHCGFLVALIVSPHGPPQRCPRCDGVLPLEPSDDATSPTDSLTDEASKPTAYEVKVGSDDSATAKTGDVPELAATDVEAGPSDDAEAGPSVSAAPAADTATEVPATRDTAVPRGRSGRTRRPVPSFVRGSAAITTRRRSWPWYAAGAMLSILLGLQLLLAQRDELAASARWRPWVAGLCSALPCDIPPWREPRAYTMLSRSVQPSRTMAGVLAVEANFRNDARWPQPWPTLVLTLSDIEGRDVGARAFTPSEYRDGNHGSDDQLAPGQSATVRLQVREPAPRIVAFTFDFQ